MDDRELDRLADLIARELVRALGSAAPEPRAVAPVWNQPLGDIAPKPDAQLAARTAAARRGGAAPGRSVARPARPPALDPTGRTVPIGVAPRYVLLSDAGWRALFGSAEPTPIGRAGQPGQIAFRETVRVVGPGGEKDGLRVLGPWRERSRVALSRADARRIGIDPPVLPPGAHHGAVPVTLVGPAGSCTADAVVPAAHVHLPPDRASSLDVQDGDRVSMRFGGNGRDVTLHGVLVWVVEGFTPELHLDPDEANAAGVWTGDSAAFVDLPQGRAAGHRTSRRRLITERDVDDIAARGGSLGPYSPYLITPAARDRARFLGIWRERP